MTDNFALPSKLSPGRLDLQMRQHLPKQCLARDITAFSLEYVDCVLKGGLYALFYSYCK